jgi:hypothetical protein
MLLYHLSFIRLLACKLDCRRICCRVDVKTPSVSAVLALLAVSMAVPSRAQSQPGPPAATDFQLSPRHAQDDEQQWFDRYACDGQARQQSGYDPIAAERGPVPPSVSGEYVRAMTACLTQRGYDVHDSLLEPSSTALAFPQPASPPGSPRELPYRPVSVEAGGGYTAAAGSTSHYVRDGVNAGGALNWFPSAALPIGVRIEGSYTWFKAGSELLALHDVGYNKGDQHLYGGDIDLRLNLLHLPTRQQFYLAAGVGWYRSDTTLQKLSGEALCGTRYCGVFQSLLAQEHDTSPWEPSWNAGLGWELALDNHTAFFIEARYRYIHRYLDGGGVQLVPIWLGLRF